MDLKISFIFYILCAIVYVLYSKAAGTEQGGSQPWQVPVFSVCVLPHRESTFRSCFEVVQI